MRDSIELEGYEVFALLVRTADETEPDLWAIYSNIKACQDRGKQVVEGFKSMGIEAEYCCRAYVVKGDC